MRKGLEGPATSEVLTPRSVCNGRAHTHQNVLLENSPADNSDAVDGIASGLRPLHDLRQVGLAAEAERKLPRYSTGAASFAQRKPTWLLPVSGGVPRLAEGR